MQIVLTLVFYFWLFLVLWLLFAMWHWNRTQTQKLQQALIEVTFKTAEAAQQSAKAAQEATSLLAQIIINQEKQLLKP